MTILLTHATAADAAALHAMIVKLAEFEREPDQMVATVDDIAAGIESGAARALIAWDEERPVGFALFYMTFSTWTGKPGLYLLDLFVEEADRGQGIGHAILARLAAIAVEQGGARLEWSVLDWNTDAVDFYEALGARPLDEWTAMRLDGAALKQLASTSVPA